MPDERTRAVRSAPLPPFDPTGLTEAPAEPEPTPTSPEPFRGHLYVAPMTPPWTTKMETDRTRQLTVRLGAVHPDRPLDAWLPVRKEDIEAAWTIAGGLRDTIFRALDAGADVEWNRATDTLRATPKRPPPIAAPVPRATPVQDTAWAASARTSEAE